MKLRSIREILSDADAMATIITVACVGLILLVFAGAALLAMYKVLSWIF